MKEKLSKREAKEKIDEFFSRREEINPKYVKKIKRLAMKHNIKLRKHRKRFCKKCYADLKKGKVRLNKGFKTVGCGECGSKNRWKIK